MNYELLRSFPITPSPCHPVTLSPCHLVTLSPCHPVTLSPCHLVTLSPCHPVTLSPCHPVTLSPCRRSKLLANSTSFTLPRKRTAPLTTTTGTQAPCLATSAGSVS